MANYNFTQTGAEIQVILNRVAAGYIYMGTADLTTTPDTTNPNVCYLLTALGTYTNFGNITHSSGIGIAIWNGSAWSYQNVPSSAVVYADATPTGNSTNPVQSGGVVDYAIEQEDLFFDKVLVKSKNLFNKNTAKSGTYIKWADGQEASLTGLYASDYIPVSENGLYIQYMRWNSTAIGGAVYNSSKQYIRNLGQPSSSGTYYLAYTYVSGDAYIRFTINSANLDVAQVVEGTQEPPQYYPYFTPYYSYTNLKQSLLPTPPNDYLPFGCLKFIESDNLINLNDADFETGKFLKNNKGEFDPNASYNTTGYIPVNAGNTYAFGDGSTDTPYDMRFGLYYNAEKEPIKSSYFNSNTKTTTAPSGAVYLRISYASAVTYPQLNKGNYPHQYTQFNKLIPSGDVAFPSNCKNSFNSLRDSGTINGNSALSVPILHIQKNVIVSAIIDGTFTKISVGVGRTETSPYRGYGSAWIEVDSTNIKLYRHFTSSTLYATFTHGLTLDSKTFVSIESSVDTSGMSTIISLTNSKGERYTTTTDKEWGVGSAFVENNSSSSIDAEVSFFPRDIAKDVWVFADSYLSFVNDQRWGYYATADGNTNFLANNQPGLAAEAAYLDLRNLLEMGHTPKMLIWMLGMNGNADTESGGVYTIAAYQKKYIDAVMGLCEGRGITPVLYCVPTVPEYQKTGLDNYVKSLNVRYIDAAAAVGTDATGAWTEGLLSSDNVHPTEAGARVLYGQILCDAPEISIK